MTISNFILALEGYYGQYERPVKEYLLRFLTRENPVEDYLTQLYQDTVESYSTKWRTPPDAAVIKELMWKLDKRWVPRAMDASRQLPESTEGYLPRNEAVARVSSILENLEKKKRITKRERKHA